MRIAAFGSAMLDESPLVRAREALERDREFAASAAGAPAHSAGPEPDAGNGPAAGNGHAGEHTENEPPGESGARPEIGEDTPR